MLKQTLKFIIYCAVVMTCSCEEIENQAQISQKLHYQDSLSEARIDSAYREIRMNCDTLMAYQVPKMVDSLLKDSTLEQHFFDTDYVYNDADNKVEKVIRQLLADCDSNLLKETYRRVQLRQKLKPKRRKK